jgi:hypothetical protein
LKFKVKKNCALLSFDKTTLLMGHSSSSIPCRYEQIHEIHPLAVDE